MAFINGIGFLLETGHDRAAEIINLWIALSIYRDSVCASLDLVLYATNPDSLSTRPPAFDVAAESAILSQVVATFRWLSPPTATAGDRSGTDHGSGVLPGVAGPG